MDWIQRLSKQLPSLCAVCHGWGFGRVCHVCLERYGQAARRCVRCARQVPDRALVCGACVVRPPTFTQALSAVDYAFPWASLLVQLKFQARLDLLEPLVDLLHRASTEHLRHQARPDVLLPVPLHPIRLRERGFNQAWALSKRLGARLQIPTSPQALQRVQNTAHQVDISLSQRHANMRGVFALAPAYQRQLQGAHVVVVDDVLTTGATAQALARVLLDRGVTRVDVWTVARTPAPRVRQLMA